MNLFPIDHVIVEIAKSLETGSSRVLSVELVLMFVSTLTSVIFLTRTLLLCSVVA